MMRQNLCVRYAALSLIVVCFPGLAVSSASPDKRSENNLKRRAVETLRDIMRSSTEFKKVHAAEALLLNGYPQGVKAAFLAEEASAPPRYRIGVWRVLAQAEGRNRVARERYIAKIRAVFSDPTAVDQIHALESLGKLGYTEHSPEMVKAATKDQEKLARMARWVVANSREPQDEALLIELLRSSDSDARGDAAYTLRFYRNISPALQSALRDCLAKEPADSESRVYVVSAAYVHASVQERTSLNMELLKFARTGKPDERYETCFARAAGRDWKDIALLEAWLQDADSDVRVGAAYAILAILK